MYSTDQRMKKSFTVFFLLWACIQGNAQDKYADSLQEMLKTKTEDTAKISILENLALHAYHVLDDTGAAWQYSTEALDLSRESNSVQWEV